MALSMTDSTRSGEIWVEPAGGRRDEIRRDGQRRFWVLLVQSLDVGRHTVAELLRGGPEVRARRGRGVVPVVTRGGGSPLDVGRIGEGLSDELGANDCSLVVADETSIGLVVKDDLGQPGHREWIDDTGQNQRDECDSECGECFGTHGSLPRPDEGLATSGR